MNNKYARENADWFESELRILIKHYKSGKNFNYLTKMHLRSELSMTSWIHIQGKCKMIMKIF